MRLPGYCAAFPISHITRPSRPAVQPFLHCYSLTLGLPRRRLHLLVRALGRVALLLPCGGRHGIADCALDDNARDDLPYSSTVECTNVTPLRASGEALTWDITALGPAPGESHLGHHRTPTWPQVGPPQ